jgi:hypothetical protein
MCLIPFNFSFWVTLPCATHSLIHVSPNGGNLKQNLVVNQCILCKISEKSQTEEVVFNLVEKAIKKETRRRPAVSVV